jgi:hypothetical protein
MKVILNLLFILFINQALFAQQTQPGIVYRDTINLHGYVYNELGKPIKYIYLQSTQKIIGYNIPIAAFTDTNGFFELKGIKFQDTLTFERNILYNPAPVYNRGSRYVVIYLPTAAINNISLAGPVTIAAIRKHPKIIAKFQMTNDDEIIEPHRELHLKAVFPGGDQHFMELLKQQMIYPKDAIDNNIEGTVQLGFKIEKDGSAVDFKILKGIGYGCEQQLTNIIKHLPKWRPAFENGRLVITQQTVSVEFKLTDK